MSQDGLARRVRLAMDRGGLSYRKVAAASGGELSSSYVHKLAHGEVERPSPHTLLALGRALLVPYGELMVLAGYAAPEPVARAVVAREGALPVGGQDP